MLNFLICFRSFRSRFSFKYHYNTNRDTTAKTSRRSNPGSATNDKYICINYCQYCFANAEKDCVKTYHNYAFGSMKYF